MGGGQKLPMNQQHQNHHLKDDLKNLSTLQTFKKHITSSFNNSCVPSHFTIGIRYISILHARLRNNCSNLNNDLFRNHLRDNPLCDLCGMIEDAIHYFSTSIWYTLPSHLTVIARVGCSHKNKEKWK